MDVSSTGDLYVGGLFSQAGGFPYSTGIGVYTASGGWNTTYIFSAWDIVDQLSYNTSSGILTVKGNSRSKHLWEVDFAGNVVQNLTNYTAYWHTDNGSFDSNCYWSN